MLTKAALKPALAIALLSLMAVFMLETTALAQSFSRVDITPRRVILNPRDRGGEFTLLNLGTEESNIRISLINYKQNEDGSYTELQAPLNPAFNPEETLRLSPRQFTLPHGGRQKVRFSIRKPADLPEGEYRFHIMATRLGQQSSASVLGTGEKSIGLVPNIGAAIPVVVRHGNVQADASLSDLHYIPSNAQGRPELQFTINRSGNASTFGSVKVIWVPAGGGQGGEIGQSNNLNVFTEITQRRAMAILNSAPEGPGTFHVVYMNEETNTPYADAKLAK